MKPEDRAQGIQASAEGQVLSDSPACMQSLGASTRWTERRKVVPGSGTVVGRGMNDRMWVRAAKQPTGFMPLDNGY